ncbi:aldose 1-epimerase [Labrys okinawensis]|uniref:aldose 1-epimerase n=1 Tax=Labrys okinawensis TaxID=346911 RepID=UPI0039BCC2EF
MSDIRLENEALIVDVAPQGGALWRVMAKVGGREVPLLRAPPESEERNPLHAASFPLVPFGNRVRGNRFRFEGRDHAFQPNMPWDKHYLHGDGWTARWVVAEQAPNFVRLDLQAHHAPGTPYVYEAQQTIRIDGNVLEMALGVTNRGETALPFGLGWHPYFPLTPGTRLTAVASDYWEEDGEWLPTMRKNVSGDIVFAQAAPLPRQWVNTLFEGWDGKAEITWAESGLNLQIEADPLFGRYLIFVSDPAFDPGYAYEFFCFEPMSHSADAHHHADGGGLKRLAPGEGMAGKVRMRWMKA